MDFSETGGEAAHSFASIERTTGTAAYDDGRHSAQGVSDATVDANDVASVSNGVGSNSSTSQLAVAESAGTGESVSNSVNNDNGTVTSGVASAPSTVHGGSKYDRPQETFMNLIAHAIMSSPRKMMVLTEIYDSIQSTYPYFSNDKKSAWQNAVRHNLSLHRDCFVKVPRYKVDLPTTSCYWKLTDRAEAVYESGKNLKKAIVHPRRRTNNRAHRRHGGGGLGVQLGANAMSRASAAHPAQQQQYVSVNAAAAAGAVHTLYATPSGALVHQYGHAHMVGGGGDQAQRIPAAAGAAAVPSSGHAVRMSSIDPAVAATTAAAVQQRADRLHQHPPAAHHHPHQHMQAHQQQQQQHAHGSRFAAVSTSTVAHAMSSLTQPMTVLNGHVRPPQQPQQQLVASPRPAAPGVASQPLVFFRPVQYRRQVTPPPPSQQQQPTLATMRRHPPAALAVADVERESAAHATVHQQPAVAAAAITAVTTSSRSGQALTTGQRRSSSPVQHIGSPPIHSCQVALGANVDEEPSAPPLRSPRTLHRQSHDYPAQAPAPPTDSSSSNNNNSSMLTQAQGTRQENDVTTAMMHSHSQALAPAEPVVNAPHRGARVRNRMRSYSLRNTHARPSTTVQSRQERRARLFHMEAAQCRLLADACRLGPSEFRFSRKRGLRRMSAQADGAFSECTDQFATDEKVDQWYEVGGNKDEARDIILLMCDEFHATYSAVQLSEHVRRLHAIKHGHVDETRAAVDLAKSFDPPSMLTRRTSCIGSRARSARAGVSTPRIASGGGSGLQVPRSSAVHLLPSTHKLVNTGQAADHSVHHASLSQPLQLHTQAQPQVQPQAQPVDSGDEYAAEWREVETEGSATRRWRDSQAQPPPLAAAAASQQETSALSLSPSGTSQAQLVQVYELD
eukprot:scpid88612/ scgid9233/ Forkhead box protein G1; Brain factor 1